MSDEEFDPFHLSSGLPLSGATVTVTKFEFGYDQSYAADALVAMVYFTPDEGDAPERPQLYSTGQGFEVTRDGKMQHKSGKPTNLSDNSTWGRFIKAFTEMKGAPDAMSVTREAGTGPFDDKWLIGMRFVLGDLTYMSYAGKGNPEKEKTLIVPVEYLGIEGGKAPVKSPSGGGKLAPKPGTKGKSAVVEPTVEDDENKGGDDDNDFGIDDPAVLKQIIKAAIAADNFDEFTDAALEIDGVTGNKPWQKAVMSSKPDSIWAVHGGG